MEHTKKMILVDPKMLENLQQQQQQQQRKPSPVPDAATDSAGEIGRQMAEILKEPEVTASQADAYHQLLRKYLLRLDQIRQRPLGTVQLTKNPNTSPFQTIRKEEEVEDDNTSRVERSVLESLPKTLKSKGKMLLSQLRKNPTVEWNDRGNLVYQQRVIEGSNAVDLLNDVLRQRKTAPDPTGWEVFASVLKDDNTPKELISNPRRLRWMREEGVESPKPKTKRRRQRSPPAWLHL